jgi:hypothetical protein
MLQLYYFMNFFMNLLVTCFNRVILKSIDVKWARNLNFYHRVLRGEKDTCENSSNLVDRIDRTKIINLFGFSSYYSFLKLWFSIFETRNSQTLNIPNRNVRTPTTSDCFGTNCWRWPRTHASNRVLPPSREKCNPSIWKKNLTKSTILENRFNDLPI